MLLHWLLPSLGVLSAVPTLAQQAGTFRVAGDTQVSGMMVRVETTLFWTPVLFPASRCLWLATTRSTFLTRSKEIPTRSTGTPNTHQSGWYFSSQALWFIRTVRYRDLSTNTATPIDVETNAFCAAGMHLPNGSYALFGGNSAVGPGGDNSAAGSTTAFDPTYQDYDGTQAIRVFDSCDDSAPCTFHDNVTQMAKHRWYPAAEPMADGTVVIIGGFTAGGYINRNYPNTDPAYEGGAAEPTYEFYPARSQSPQVMDFMVKTSGLNSYALTYLMPSGKMFVQANYSTSEVILFFLSISFTDYSQCSGTLIRIPKPCFPICRGRLSEYTPRQERMPCCP